MSKAMVAGYRCSVISDRAAQAFLMSILSHWKTEHNNLPILNKVSMEGSWILS